MKAPRFKLKESTTPLKGITHEAGKIVYLCTRHDYGCASTDSNFTGVKHVAVTLSSDGDYPFFTVPESILEPMEPAVTNLIEIATNLDGSYTVRLETDGQVHPYAIRSDSPAGYAIAHLQNKVDDILKSWLLPEPDMIEAGREELVRTIQENTFVHLDEVDEDVLNDAVVFVNQAMCEKRPK